MKRSPDRDIENVSPTTRKSLKKKAGMMQVDKEAREGVKNLEINFDEINKKLFNEINRLASLFE